MRYCQNVERLIPWRTLTGRQHLYLDHEGYIAFGENLPTFKPRITLEASESGEQQAAKARSSRLTASRRTASGTSTRTYSDDLRMLTLSRGVEPFWLNDKDAGEIGVQDNDWVEAYNDNGVIVTRAVVSARIPTGICCSTMRRNGPSLSQNPRCARIGAAGDQQRHAHAAEAGTDGRRLWATLLSLQ